MSLPKLRRLLTGFNLVAVFAVAATAHAFVEHGARLASDAAIPGFRPLWESPPEKWPEVDHIGMPLGLYHLAGESTLDAQPVDSPPMPSALSRLGTVVAVVTVSEPYPPYPAVLFKYHETHGGRPRILAVRLGEALETRPHPDPRRRAHDRVPWRFRFVGWRPDPTNPEWTYVFFDVDCDGKNIQALHWKGETLRELPRSVELTSRTPPSGISVLERLPGELPAIPGGPLPTTLEVPEPTHPSPDAGGRGPRTRSPDSPSVEVFVPDGDTLRLTRRGRAYIRTHLERILRDVDAAPYESADGSMTGVVIRRVRPGSGAEAFGIFPDDLVLAINGRPVGSREQALRLVKHALARGERLIEVKLLRDGRPLTKRFDAQDPEVARAARRRR